MFDKKKLIDYCDYRIEEQEKKQGGLFCVYVSECLSECLSVCCERKAENTKLDGGGGEKISAELVGLVQQWWYQWVVRVKGCG